MRHSNAHFCVENTIANRDALAFNFRISMPASVDLTGKPYLFARYINTRWEDYSVKETTKPQGPVLPTEAISAISMLETMEARAAFISSFK